MEKYEQLSVYISELGEKGPGEFDFGGGRFDFFFIFIFFWGSRMLGNGKSVSLRMAI